MPVLVSVSVLKYQCQIGYSMFIGYHFSCGQMFLYINLYIPLLYEKKSKPDLFVEYYIEIFVRVFNDFSVISKS